MGIFGFFRTLKESKDIEALLEKINYIFSDYEYAEYKNRRLFSQPQINEIDVSLCRIVELVRSIENICDNGDRDVLRASRYHNRWCTRLPLWEILNISLGKVLKIRNNLGLPSVYQEEIGVFGRYKYDENSPMGMFR